MNADITVDYAAPVYYVKGISDAGKNWIELMAGLVNATVYPLCSIALEREHTALELIDAARHDGMMVSTNFAVVNERDSTITDLLWNMNALAETRPTKANATKIEMHKTQRRLNALLVRGAVFEHAFHILAEGKL